jgi:enoyl-CoA hydratase
MAARYDRYDALGIDWAAPGVLKVAFNRPERRNAMDDRVHRQISEIWPDIDRDDEVLSVLVRGEGSDFCVGGEPGLVVDMMESREQRRRTMREAHHLVHNMIACEKPIVSAMQGSVVGGGLAVGLLADISIAAKDAQLLDGHLRIGLAAGDHAVLIWPLLCGLAKAKFHVMMNQPVSGEEAERIGLVSLAVEGAELDTIALEAAKTLAGTAPFAVRATKYAFNGWLRAAGPHFDLSHASEEMAFDTSELERAVDRIRERTRK